MKTEFFSDQLNVGDIIFSTKYNWFAIITKVLSGFIYYKYFNWHNEFWIDDITDIFFVNDSKHLKVK